MLCTVSWLLLALARKSTEAHLDKRAKALEQAQGKPLEEALGCVVLRSMIDKDTRMYVTRHFGLMGWKSLRQRCVVFANANAPTTTPSVAPPAPTPTTMDIAAFGEAGAWQGDS